MSYTLGQITTSPVPYGSNLQRPTRPTFPFFGVYPNINIPPEEPAYDEDVTNADEYVSPGSFMQRPGEPVNIPEGIIQTEEETTEDPAVPPEKGVGGMAVAPVLLIGAAVIGYFFIKK